MRKKNISGFKGCTATLNLTLLVWLSLSGFAGELDPKNKSLQDQEDPFKFHFIEFHLTLTEPFTAPNAPLFTLAQRRSETQDKNQEIFTVPQIKKENPGSFETSQRPDPGKPLEKTLYTASLLSLTALNIADYVSTAKALQQRELEEGNPLMRPFTKNIFLFSALKIGISIYDFYLLKKIYKKNKTAGWILSLAGNLVMSYIVSNNLRKIQAVTRK